MRTTHRTAAATKTEPNSPFFHLNGNQGGYPHPLWFEWLSDYLKTPAFPTLLKTIKAREKTEVIFPPKSLRFSAYTMDPRKIRVVILGQDPYHGLNQANGLAFSVADGQRLPPSLRNIFLEVEQQGFTTSKQRSGDLRCWQEQGVLLLNTVLTVASGQPGAHRNLGWEAFTDATVDALNTHGQHLVFLLWGRDARTKATRIDQQKHLVLESPHPSPFSADKGFFGNQHFQKANAWLQEHHGSSIQW